LPEETLETQVELSLSFFFFGGTGMSGWTFNSVTIAVGLYPLLGHLTFHICHVKYLSHRVVGTT
jgi:hypothetical protein